MGDNLYFSILVTAMHYLEGAFEAESIAIVGASNRPGSSGYRFTLHLIEYGYPGKIYPVTPHWGEVLGRKAYATIKDIPGPVEYVISCLPAHQLRNLISECGDKGIKFIHLFTARLAETDKAALISYEKELLKEAQKYNIRLIGPNCMGIYYPKKGRAFSYDFPMEPGKVGVFSQSGGNAAELVNYASLRGIRFSKVVSYGNALDLNEVDFLDYLVLDPETKIIVGYVEGVKEGRRFFDSLRRGVTVKPIIILKGGKSSAGAKAAASHTAALAGSASVWKTAMRQAGVIEAETLEDLIDLLVSFYFLPRIDGGRVGIFGGGGGRSVLSTDEWEEAGFTVPALPEEIERYIHKTLPELWWGWMRNPVDISILPEEQLKAGLNVKIMRMMAQSSAFDLLVANILVGGPFQKSELIDQAKKQALNIIDVAKNGTKPMAVILNTGFLGAPHLVDQRWKGLAEINSMLLESHLPVYRDSRQATGAIIRMIDYFRRVGYATRDDND